MPATSRFGRDRLQIRNKDKLGRWYRIENAVEETDTTPIYIYDEIGYWGVTSDEFVRDLMKISTANIDLHINSPGGEIFDAFAIYNALVAHSATVRTSVDGLAASAASYIAMAGDERSIAKTAMMMIHDALGLCIGNAADMREMADLLDRSSDSIASIYADRAGGSLADWRERMRAETWYSGQEAVDAGLMNEVYNTDSKAENTWDLTIFNYAGREHAPAPVLVARTTTPATSVNEPPKPEGSGPVLIAEKKAIIIAEPDDRTSDETRFTFDPVVFKAAVSQAIEPVIPVEQAPWEFDKDLFHTLLDHHSSNAPATPRAVLEQQSKARFSDNYDPEDFRAFVRDAVTNRQ